MALVQAFRVTLFYLLLSSSSFFWCLISLVVAPLLPFRQRYRFVVQAWCNCAVWLAKVIVGIRYEVRGLENIPERPCVILSNHQSTWETFFLSGFFEPLSQVVKRELLRVPFFGWGMALLKPIAIDRSNPKAALKQLAKQGDERLKQGAWVLVFPEGTRIPPGQIGKFSRGGTALAVNAGLPVLPIAHNAGEFWPKAGWGKRPGTIQVIIGQPMYAEGEGPRAIAELNERAFQWVRQQQTKLRGEEPQLSRLGETA
ncbi:1-acyl-sn-glycerol-3-phosphate acyltransferase [Pseudomonas chengduensis]|jgi:1-acyl-sn-glycerol-3-phosphate acyltransferase|nr:MULTISPECIES: lysophospholipid acyltransferase family protein [Pseudomonas]MDH0621687.1 1-acyl-sn-glycerol-3-phosphate acyltransferase [Pseudomonas chengduensis]MDH0956346.1 1-acyl-sn-glycerol-3-phosphate acyltransferase [Pseudomonas chengduensis]MDH1210113.1 1-acyl-sn-glycerol-3-phosphate acyltransferase [Pseudomonas chengduensis]MDH1279843.1 1-acyl-sn-glycerol-3-phosphate acyltransferase [Pseudomonas chengduensis]MDH1667181.1 1-acyl-sn-glycerol-3-phosphate acyltransferase [Pseudomonas che|tara:strand:- start:159 stop:926 length:768 start_codon:yes stop_codon:yes gene_type:complete